MNAHVRAGGKTKVIHAVMATPVDMHDATLRPDLLHGDEMLASGDQAYRGQPKVVRAAAWVSIGAPQGVS